MKFCSKELDVITSNYNFCVFQGVFNNWILIFAYFFPLSMKALKKKWRLSWVSFFNCVINNKLYIVWLWLFVCFECVYWCFSIFWIENLWTVHRKLMGLPVTEELTCVFSHDDLVFLKSSNMLGFVRYFIVPFFPSYVLQEVNIVKNS